MTVLHLSIIKYWLGSFQMHDTTNSSTGSYVNPGNEIQALDHSSDDKPQVPPGSDSTVQYDESLLLRSRSPSSGKEKKAALTRQIDLTLPRIEAQTLGKCTKGPPHEHQPTHIDTFDTYFQPIHCAWRRTVTLHNTCDVQHDVQARNKPPL